MNTKIFNNSRFRPKGDIEANWNKAVGFVPFDKEIIIYKADAEHSVARFKIGDGKTVVQDLPFAGADMAAIKKLIDEKGKLLIEYVDNAVSGLATEEYVNEAVAAIKVPEQIQADWNQTDENAKDYIKNKPFYENTIIKDIDISWDGIIAERETIEINSCILAKISDRTDLTVEEIRQLQISFLMVESKEEYWSQYINEFSIEIFKQDSYYIGAYDDVEKDIVIIYDIDVFNQDFNSNAVSSGIYLLSSFDDGVGIFYAASLKGYFEYYNIQKLDEKYIPSNIVREEMIRNLEIKKLTAIFNIITDETSITLQNITGAAIQIDWGDGVINNDFTHIYKEAGTYICKIYGVTSIGYSAFRDCSSLTSVEIPNGIVSIDNFAFSGCSRLTEVVIPDSVTSIGYEAFKYCNNLTKLIIPNSVTSIGEYAFRGCSSLTEVVIPYSVTSIGGSAFSSCDSLTNIKIPDSVTSIGGGAFALCSLTNIKIPDSITSIGGWTFEDCSSLTEIVIPDSVTSIGSGAFRGCSSLTNVTFKNSVPIDYIKSYLDEALLWFDGCTSLTHIYVPYGCKQIYVDKWISDGASQDILDKIVESDREATMSDVNTLETNMQEWVKQYIADNFATLMAEYLNSTEATENKPTAADISEVFNENKEA